MLVSFFFLLLVYLLNYYLGVALSSEDATGFDLTQPRAMASCGAATISKGEFSLCDVNAPVFLSVWNLEDKHRAVELSFSYSKRKKFFFLENY